jgi:hypothetical protein
MPKERSSLTIVDFETIRPFEDADMRPAILLASKGPTGPGSFIFAAPRRTGELRIGQWQFACLELSPHLLEETAGNGWSLDRLSTPVISPTRSASSSSGKLLDVAKRIYSGIKPGATEAFVVPASLAQSWIEENPAASEIARPFFRGQDRHPYSFDTPKDYILLVTSKDEFHRVPCIKKHLESYREHLEQRGEVLRGGAEWYALRACDYYEVFSGTIITWPDTAKQSRFCFLPKGSVIGNTAFCIRSSCHWLLPILNSRIGWRLISLICQSRDERAGLLRYRLLPQFMANFPVSQSNESALARLENVAKGKEQHTPDLDRMIEAIYAEAGINLTTVAAP